MVTEHPAIDILLDLSLGDLPEQQAADVRDHLIDCPECRDALRRLLEEPDGPPALEEPVSREEKAEAWWQLSQSIRGSQAEDRPPALDSKPAPRGPATASSGSGPRFRPRLVGTAAAAAVFAFGVGFFVGGDPDGASTRVGAWTVLEGERAASRGDTEPVPVTCPLTAGDFVWSLPLPVDAPSGARYRLEVERPDGTIEAGFLVPQDDFGQILITRPRGRTPDGIYTIRIEDADRAEIVEEIRFAVACD